MDVSIVIPVYNEVDNVALLDQSIREAMKDCELQYEVLMVDDGSTDGTRDKLKEIACQSDHVRAIFLRRNFGQTTAMSTGIEQARGRVTVTMDGDLQNDPADIPRMVALIGEGYDLVAGWRKKRDDRMISRKIPSRIANWIIRWITKVPIHDTGCSLKAYRTSMIQGIPLYAELHRFIPAMCTMATSRFAEIVVRHHPRQHGESKYGLGRIGRVMLDVLTVKMLISSAHRPLHWFGRWALLCFLLSMSMFSAAIILGLTGHLQSSTVLPIVSVLIIYLAAHLMFTGLLGELVVIRDPDHSVAPLVQQRIIHTPDHE